KLTPARRFNRFSRVAVSMSTPMKLSLMETILEGVREGMLRSGVLLCALPGLPRIGLTRFEARHFEDFTWRTLFSKSLAAGDFQLVARANHRVCSVPWQTMHTVGTSTRLVWSHAVYPRLDTRGIDVFISQTPYPGRLDRRTALVVRYHDTIPIFMPHTISDRARHQAAHFNALEANVRHGGYFACVSEATRSSLLGMYPRLEERCVTIHNMLSPHYFAEESDARRVPDIIRSRLYADFEDETRQYGLVPSFLTLRERDTFYERNLRGPGLKYLLVVSTVEPRKNHARVVAAWELLKATVDPSIKLVLVGTLGWEYGTLLKQLRSWIDRGEVFMLNAVPAPDLRILYRHAAATICPSLGEGFDFSGAEAMRCGGIAIASDIPAHREVYSDAAEYFDPYSTPGLAHALTRVLYGDAAEPVARGMRERGAEVSARYQAERIAPKWHEFLERVARKPRALFEEPTQPDPQTEAT
ncbi:MAG TPA: glycosyltransferase family 1 protein, partial [Usitatibacter sp.]|nr:glycosyltransferase family 1 protein [Usitatibacter sp.]